MTVFRELEHHLEVFTSDRDTKLQISELLSAEREGAEYESAVAAGQDDGKNYYYETNVVTGQGIFFKIGNGFKKKLLDNIVFNEIEELPKPEHQGMDFLKRVLPELPFKPRKYQLEAFFGILNNRSHLAIIPTGGGKSLLIYLMFRYLWEQDKKILLIVPTIGLTTQMFEDFKDYNAPQKLMDDIQLIGGENNNKNITKNVVFSTWQSMQNMIEKVAQFDVLMCDEAHKLRADVLTEIFKQPVSYRYGCTGSMPIIRTDAMYLEQALGEPHRYINVQELMRMDLLTDTTIVPIFMTYPRNQTRSGLKYQPQMKFFRESIPRLNYVCYALNKLKGVTVALYNTTAYGEAVYEKLTGVRLTGKKKSDFKMMKELNV